MSERPTPETDTYWQNNKYEALRDDHKISRWSDFARKLERERDEARQATAKWESSSDAMERAGAEQARRADENREWALKAERERDEAITRRMETIMQCELYEQERDEARFLLKAAQSALDAIHLEVGGWIKIFKENTD